MAYLETSSGAIFSNAQAVTATADSTNIFDVTGAGVGSAPAMIGANGVNTAMGFDVGAGEGMGTPYVLVTVVTPTTVTGSLTISLKAAPDSGSYTEGSYTTLYTSASLTGTTQLAAGAQYLIPIPPILPGEAMPRFYKLTYTVVSGSISATISAAITSVGTPTIRDVTKYGNNYSSL